MLKQGCKGSGRQERERKGNPSISVNGNGFSESNWLRQNSKKFRTKALAKESPRQKLKKLQKNATIKN